MNNKNEMIKNNYSKRRENSQTEKSNLTQLKHAILKNKSVF